MEMLLQAEWIAGGRYFVTRDKTYMVNGMQYYEKGKYFDEDGTEIDFRRASQKVMEVANGQT